MVRPHSKTINPLRSNRGAIRGGESMRPWRYHAKRLLVAGFAAWQLGLGGCQAKELQTPTSGLTPDFVSLVNMAGSEVVPPSQFVSRGQKKEENAGNSLDIKPTDPGSQEGRTARIRAVVNGEAILDEEVTAAAFQKLVGVRTEREKNEILKTTLDELIDREVILQDAVARFGKRGDGKVIKELLRYAEKEFEKQWLHRMMRANNHSDVESFRKFLRDAGMPLDMIRRQWERNFIAMEYVRSRIGPSLERIGHVQVEEFYQKNAKEFAVEDSLVWQDIFIAKLRHATPEDARRFAEALVVRIRKGEDFAKLAKEYDNGDSSLRENAEGIGRKRGEIRPVEAESRLWNMKAGQCEIVEMDTGYHIVKLTERTHAGLMPFDEKVQRDIKDKLRGQVFGTEMKRLVNDLKRRAIIEIANEIK